VDPSSTDKIETVGDHWFLANVEEDPGERKNLAAAHPEVVERLSSLKK
jgi:hypothetical protein